MERGSKETKAYSLQATALWNEDILFCIDTDAESLIEMKAPAGKPLTRLDSIKQAILLFIHSKLSINSHHRFAFSTLSNNASLLMKDFSNDVEAAHAALRGLSASPSSCGEAELTQLFQIAAHEAKKSRAQNRILRVVLIYCRSSVRPQHQWPVNRKSFTLDVIYLHDKPGPDNCPQEVFDVLVDSVEQVSEYDGYILESGPRLPRVLFRNMCVLLSHPQQRCPQDDVDIPKFLVKKVPPVDAIAVEDSVPVSSQ